MRISIKNDIKLISNYLLNRENYYEDCEVNFNKENIFFDINSLKFDNNYNDLIKEFYNKISLNSNVNLNNFKKNIKTLEIKYEQMNNSVIMNNPDCNAAYFPADNMILVLADSEIEKLCFFHELMHLSSYNKEMNNYHIGFSQYNDSFKNIGRGFNEGYTQYLTEENFGRIDGYVYKIEKNIARAVEIIIGKDRLEKLFFEADMNNFVNDLSFYSSKKEALNFLKDVDTINKINVSNPTSLEVKMMYTILRKINNYLTELFLKKQMLYIDNVEEFENNLICYLDILTTKIKYNKTIYNTLLPDDLNEKIYKICNFKEKENMIEDINDIFFDNKKKKLLFK